MDVNEAIRILDPGTTRAALAEIEYYGGFSGEDTKWKAVRQACEIAVAVMRAQQADEKNEPLTIAELREMDGQPVWIKFTGRNVDDRWIIVGSTSWYVLDLCDLSDYGVRWIAYSRPPKGD